MYMCLPLLFFISLWHGKEVEAIMIKVMHFIHRLSAGGAEVLVKNYMLNLDQNKFDLVLLCLKHNKELPFEGILDKKGVRMIFVEDYLLFKKRRNIFTKLIGYCQSYFVVRRIIRNESPDVLHTHLPINTFVKFSKPSNKTKIIHTVHNEPKVLWFSGKIGRGEDLKAAKWLVKHYNMKFIVLHEKMREEINRVFGVTDSVVLNNGINLDVFNNVNSKSQVRRSLGVSQDAFIIGHVGRFSEQKNHVFLVDLFKQLKALKKNAFLLMVGDGMKKREIKERLERCGLNGQYMILSNRDDIPDLLSAMDVFVFPSLYEGVPISLIEAQEVGLPCFVSDSVDGYAVISNLVTLLPLSDGVKRWTDAIIEYNVPRRAVIEDDNWDIMKVTKQLEQLYLETLLEKKNGKK